MIFTIYCTYIYTYIWSNHIVALARDNRLFDVATDKETRLKTNIKHHPLGPAMTRVVLFIHANLAVREGFQQSQERRHIGKLPPATVEISSFVDNGRCTSSVPIWNSRFGSVHHPIIQSSQEQSSWQSPLTDISWQQYQLQDLQGIEFNQLTPWLDLEGMKLLVKVPTSGWFPTTFFDLVQKRKDWWRKDLKAEVNPLGWHPKIVETYQLIGWHHLSSPSKIGWHLFVERWSWIMILTYTCHMSPGVPGYDSNPFHINVIAKWQRHSCNSLWSLDGPRQSCPPQPKHGASLDAQPNEAVL